MKEVQKFFRIYQTETKKAFYYIMECSVHHPLEGDKLSAKLNSQTKLNRKTMGQKDTIELEIGEGNQVLTASTKVNQKVSLLGLPLTKLSVTSRFLVCSSAVFVFYLLYGYMLELIFTLEEMRPFGWYLTLIQFAYYTLFAYVQIRLSGEPISRKIPFNTYIIIAILTVGTMGFSNTSVGYLNYPTQVIFKSCKLIPVMIGSMIILGKRYNFTEVVACICMCLGLIWFTLADSSIQPKFSFIGVALVSSALVCDAIIGNVQEGAMKRHKEGPAHVVFYSYGIGFFIILVALICINEFFVATSFSLQHPWEVYGRAVLLSASGFCGVQAVLTLVTLHGALIAVTVTTCRKALTICLSFLLFTKPFTLQYLWGGLLVIAGMYLNLYSKNNNNKTSIIVSMQQLYMKTQQFFSPRVSIRHIRDREMLNV